MKNLIAIELITLEGVIKAPGGPEENVSGKGLFAEEAVPSAFELTECQTSPAGVIIANYKRVGGVKTGTFD